MPNRIHLAPEECGNPRQLSEIEAAQANRLIDRCRLAEAQREADAAMGDPLPQRMISKHQVPALNESFADLLPDWMSEDTYRKYYVDDLENALLHIHGFASNEFIGAEDCREKVLYQANLARRVVKEYAEVTK